MCHELNICVTNVVTQHSCHTQYVWYVSICECLARSMCHELNICVTNVVTPRSCHSQYVWYVSVCEWHAKSIRETWLERWVWHDECDTECRVTLKHSVWLTFSVQCDWHSVFSVTDIQCQTFSVTPLNIHIHESCRTYGWLMYVCETCVTLTFSCHSRVKSCEVRVTHCVWRKCDTHTYMSHVAHVDESCLTHG